MALTKELAIGVQAETLPLHFHASRIFDSILFSLDNHTVLPADKLYPNLNTQPVTSPTNIGLTLLSLVAARELDLIDVQSANSLIKGMVKTLTGKTMALQSGLPVNWYDTQTSEPLRFWPSSNNSNRLFYSSVDSAWFVAGLYGASQAFPQIPELQQLLDCMALGRFYKKTSGLCAGELSLDGIQSQWDYGVLTEARIISYMGVALGQLPVEHLSHLWNSARAIQSERYPDWHQKNPQTSPTWGGSSFEAFMVSLVFNEHAMAPQIFCESHHNHAAAQWNHADPATHLWGFSPCMIPGNEMYGEFGVKSMGLWRNGYETGITKGDRLENIISPYAVYLALLGDEPIALTGLQKIEEAFPKLFGRFGYPDSINTHTKEASSTILVLDQCMSFLALAQYLKPECVRKYFMPLEKTLAPHLSSWRFPN